MHPLQHLFDNNVAWTDSVVEDNATFFDQLSKQQAPAHLWIGCADSRVPANVITGLMPGEMFVHRNIANVVVHSDLNCLSVIQYAVEVLKVEHIIVCGHYGCGGVQGAMQEEQSLGLIDNWLRHIQDVMNTHAEQLNALPSQQARFDRLCELNVIEQVVNVCRTSIVHDAWKHGQTLTVHGWIYGLADGRLRHVTSPIASLEAMRRVHAEALGESG